MSPLVDIGDGGPPIDLPEGFWPDRARAALARGDRDLSITRQIRDVLDREHTEEDLHMLRSRGHSWRVLLNHELSRRRHGLHDRPEEQEEEQMPRHRDDIPTELVVTQPETVNECDVNPDDINHGEVNPAGDAEDPWATDPQEPQEPVSEPDPPSLGEDTDSTPTVAAAPASAAEDLNLAALVAAGYDPMTSIHFKHLTPQERQRYAQRGARRG